MTIGKRLAMAAGLVLLLGIPAEALAASARVECTIDRGRLRVKVDGQDVTEGTYIANLVNRTTGATATTEAGKEQSPDIIPPAVVGDVDLDFDSTADPTDGDSFISTDFARRRDTVSADVVQLESGDIVASATTRCRRGN